MKLLVFAFAVIAAVSSSSSHAAPASGSVSSVKAPATAPVAGEISSEMRSSIEKVVTEVRESTGAPSISLAIVKDAKVAFAQTYGDARIEPKRVPATVEMRYNIASVSKQFTAAAVLFLVDDGKISLDDKASKYLPSLAQRDVTLRQLLSHTSGYRDYWPQDYAMPPMLKPTTPEQIVAQFGETLDFVPGSDWQYSNTGFVVAGLVVEKVTNTPLIDFLQARAFQPLGMSSVIEAYGERSEDPVRYTRFALGPLRTAPSEGRGWLFGAGSLAMTASDLAKWNAAIIERRVFAKLSTHDEMERAVVLKNGMSTQYALGLAVHAEAGKRVLEHGGAVMGFATSNTVFADEKLAVTVMTNLDPAAGDAAAIVAGRVTKLLFAERNQAVVHERRNRAIVEGLQHGKIERAHFTANCRSYFTSAALKDFATGLHPLGEPKGVKLTRQRQRGGLVTRVYDVEFPADKKLEIVERTQADGKIESWIISPGS